MHDTRAKNAYMKAERASAELRRGGHVMLRFLYRRLGTTLAFFSTTQYINGVSLLRELTRYTTKM